MSLSPEDFAQRKISDACSAALQIMEYGACFWSDDACARELIQYFAERFASFIDQGYGAVNARDRTVQLILTFRNRLLVSAMQRRFDETVTPYGDGEPVRESWKVMNVPLVGRWETITYEQIQRMIDIALEALREDLLYSTEPSFDDANSANVQSIIAELEGQPD